LLGNAGLNENADKCSACVFDALTVPDDATVDVESQLPCASVGFDHGTSMGGPGLGDGAASDVADCAVAVLVSTLGGVCVRAVATSKSNSNRRMWCKKCVWIMHACADDELMFQWFKIAFRRQRGQQSGKVERKKKKKKRIGFLISFERCDF
jgi:hypothetical protein